MEWGDSGSARAIVDAIVRDINKTRTKCGCRLLFIKWASMVWCKIRFEARPNHSKSSESTLGYHHSSLSHACLYGYRIERLGNQSAFGKIKNQNQIASSPVFSDAPVMALRLKKQTGAGSERALSSVVEHYLHTVGVVGSKPTARTTFPKENAGFQKSCTDFAPAFNPEAPAPNPPSVIGIGPDPTRRDDTAHPCLPAFPGLDQKSSGR